MSRVVSILSKTKEQKIEYKKIKNEKFDKKIIKEELKLESLKKQKADFNEKIDKQIAELKD